MLDDLRYLLDYDNLYEDNVFVGGLNNRTTYFQWDWQNSTSNFWPWAASQPQNETYGDVTAWDSN